MSSNIVNHSKFFLSKHLDPGRKSNADPGGSESDSLTLPTEFLFTFQVQNFESFRREKISHRATQIKTSVVCTFNNCMLWISSHTIVCRGANFYVALYWAEELAAKDKAWEPLAKALKDNEEKIMKDLIDCQVKRTTWVTEQQPAM